MNHLKNQNKITHLKYVGISKFMLPYIVFAYGCQKIVVRQTLAVAQGVQKIRDFAATSGNITYMFIGTTCFGCIYSKNIFKRIGNELYAYFIISFLFQI